MGVRLNKVLREFNVGLQTVVDYLQKKGFTIDSNMNAKLTEEEYTVVRNEFGSDKNLRTEADNLISQRQTEKTAAKKKPAVEEIRTEIPVEIRPQFKPVGKIDLDAAAKAPAAPSSGPAAGSAQPKAEPPVAKEPHAEKKAEPTAAAAEKPQPEPSGKPVPQKPEAAPEVQPQPKADATPAPEKKAAPAPAKAPVPAGAEAKAGGKAKAGGNAGSEAKASSGNEAKTSGSGAEVKTSSSAEESAPHGDGKKAKHAKQADAVGTVSDGVFHLTTQPTITGPKVLGTIDLSTINENTRPRKKTKEERRKEREEKFRQQHVAVANGQKKKRNRINANKVDITTEAKKVTEQSRGQSAPKPNGGGGNPRNNNGGNGYNGQQRQGQQHQGQQRQGQGQGQQRQGQQQRPRNNKRPQQQPVATPARAAVSDEDVAKEVKKTLARLTSKGSKFNSAKYRREKRDMVRANMEERMSEEASESKVLKLTEFVTANELASMMDVPVTKVISTCMSIGMMISINQRMDAETINLVAEEFGYKTEYVSASVSEAIQEEEDTEEDLKPRDPIVTVMGHVDHGKTSLLDYIRKANVIAGEAGGITQHIGAYNVTLENGRHITFLDTPGHEAFTAMRARGAQVTDIAIIIIAADDDVMPQTKEAINHAMAANVPIVFAINKIDKPGANPEKIKETLANMNFLVEDWGGKYQSQDISAKKGLGVKELLEKVLLEADMLELKANPDRKATGTIIESSLDKGRGYVATILVSNGTLHIGDNVIAGTCYGRVKDLTDERGKHIDNVGPAKAATLLGLNGAPQAGDSFHVMESEQEVREIANKRLQLQREQGLRTHKLPTLDELGRRIAMGGFQELNIIVKGDVDGSVEALGDSLIKLSTQKIAVKVIHKAVGQISESDVSLAAASQAIIIGFQVRPSQKARREAEQQGVDIRLYSVIYDAIHDVESAMEGMLKPIIKEEVTASLEVRQVYHISKVGTVAGAFVTEGKVKRTDKARLIREGIVKFTGEINALKRFKDDVKEVGVNFECGISLANCNDIQEGDTIEAFQEVEVKQKL